MSSTTATTPTVELERKTYWCHECDMGVALLPSSSSSPSLLCPNCNTNFIELMDSPPFPHSETHFPSSLSLLDGSYLLPLIQQNLASSDDQDSDFPSLSLPISSLSSIPTIQITSSFLNQLHPEGLLCAVCKDPINVDSQAKQLPCNHLYHSDCISPWLSSHNSCPLCRLKVSPEEDHESSRMRRIRRQLRRAMIRLAELVEEEEEEGDVYGLRTTLRHIALHSSATSSAGEGGLDNSFLSLLPTQMGEHETGSVNTIERALLNPAVGGDEEEEMALSNEVNVYAENAISACRFSSTNSPR